MTQLVPYTFAARVGTIPLSQLDDDLLYVSGKWISAKDAAFGGSGAGVIDDLPAISAAIAFLSASGGGTLLLPAGTWLVSGAIQFPSNVSIIGAGRGATTVKLMSGSSLNSSHGIFEPQGYGTGVGPLGYYAKNNTIAHLSIDGNIAGNVGHFYEGVAGGQCKDLLVFDVEAFSCGEVGLQGQVTNVGTDQKSLISFVSCIAHNNTSDGFQVGGASLVNCWAYSNGGAGIDSVGNFVSGTVDDVVTTITNCRADGNTNGGITTVLQAGPHIRTVISNCSAHRNASNGIAAAMKYTTIDNCDVQFNGEDGIFLQFDYCSVTGGKSNNNGQIPGGAQNFQSGIAIIGNLNFTNITGVMLTDNQGSKTQQYPIAFSAPGSGSNNMMSDCSCAGNVNQFPYQIGLATDWIIRNNQGINPVGPFNGAVAGVPSNPAVPASTVTKTNTYSYPVQVFIAGGTVTAIAIGGVATGLTSGTFNLGTNQTIAITYTVAPTWQWFGL